MTADADVASQKTEDREATSASQRSASWLEVVRHLPGRRVCLWRSIVVPRPIEVCALNVVERHGCSKSWQVLRAHLGCRFEARSQLDERRLAECGPEEAHAQRHSENNACGNLHDGITGRGCQAGGPKDEMVSVQQVGSPGWVVRG